MRNLATLADGVEIEVLPGEFTDAIVTLDDDRLRVPVHNKTPHGECPSINQAFVGQEEIRAGIRRLQGLRDHFVHTPHWSTVQLGGKTR
jgi:hypothetical protein